jgi:hypothetical protein
MIFFGHIGISLLIGSLLSLSFLGVLIGVLLPDLIDKTILLLGMSNEHRLIGHTLFLGFLIPSIVHLILRKKLITISLLFGYMSHLVEDAIRFVPWFYPFFDFKYPHFIYATTLTIFNMIFEIVGIIILIYMYKTNPRFRNFIIDSFKLITNKKKY